MQTFGILFLVFVVPVLWAFYQAAKPALGKTKVNLKGTQIRQIITDDGIELFELVNPPRNVTHTRFFTATAAEEHVRTATGAK